MMFTAACFMIFQCIITIWGSDCPKRFIDIPTQKFFDEKQFEGKWYHQLQTTYVWGVNDWISGVESIQLTDVGIYNLTNIEYSKQEKQCKLNNSPRLTMVRKGGSYHYNKGFVEMHMSVISTNYETALVAFCFGELQDGVCPKYQSKYSIWSRSMEFPSRRVVDKMKHLVETQLCLDFTDFRESEQGLCDFGVQNNYGEIETRCPTRPGHLRTEVGVTSAYVTWTPPKDGSDVVVRGYKLGIGADFDSIQSNDVGNKYDFQHLANLVPDTEYVIKVTAYNNVGEGMATYQRIHTLKGRRHRVQMPVSTRPSRASARGAPKLWGGSRTYNRIEVEENSRIKLKCKVSGRPKPYKVWFINNTQISTHNNDRFSLRDSGLVILPTTLNDSGTYSMLAENLHGNVWCNHTLVVVPDEVEDVEKRPSCNIEGKPRWRNINKMGDYQSLPTHVKAELRCPACGTPKPNIAWYKGHERLIVNSRTRNKYRTRGWKLYIDSLNVRDEGKYTCVVENKFGKINYTIEINVIDRVLTKPVVRGPTNQTVTVGNNVTFECRLMMRGLQPHIQWIKHYKVNDSYMSPSGDPYIKLIQQSNFNVTDPEVLHLPDVTLDDAGWYTCLVSNSLGRSYQSAWLTVEAEKIAVEPMKTTPKE